MARPCRLAIPSPTSIMNRATDHGPTPMSLDELRQRLGKEWPAIAKTAGQADSALARIAERVKCPAAGEGSIDSGDISVVVFGSLARGEWTTGSDVDWTLLIDGQ